MITIYKKDTGNRIRYLTAYTTGPTLFQESGLVGTDKPLVNSKVCKSKNVGRSNETSPDQQAELELASLIAEKLKEGYFRTQAEAEGTVVIMPMLAKSYKDEAKKLNWNNVYIQRKYNGMRCLAIIKGGKVTLMSREGSEITTMEHIVKDLSQIQLDVILDGELWAPGSFQENMRLIKKYREGETEKIHFNCYDIITKKPYDHRLFNLAALLSPYHFIYVDRVETPKITSEKELKDWHKKFIAEGFEGSIVRNGAGLYKVGGRSSDLLKYKDFLDIACKIIDIEPADQRPEWAVPVFEIDGKQFRAGMKYSHAEREEWLRNKQNYIGKIAELRFFEYTEDGIPRFPVVVGIRLDKTKQD